ncbi:MAG TPA: NUDIX hydrolase family protein [Jiangellaceae bacterium]|nr:NUDIX hydrolase family protein [Jiangellaceae bacterium]
MDRTAVDTAENWLSPEELDAARRRLPMLYVNAIPVRVDQSGAVTELGLLLRATEQGHIRREVVAGRVRYHEQVRDALLRHIEKDLGAVAMPRVPPSPQPFTVAEYMPTPGASFYHDPRQHAVALAYIVPVAGDCAPQQDALDLAWLTPAEAAEDTLQAEAAGGHGLLIRQALAHLGYPPAP